MTSSTRQLAAIMPVRRSSDRNKGGFTDIVGYTALMGKDESKAMELVRHILTPTPSLFSAFVLRNAWHATYRNSSAYSPTFRAQY